MIGVTTRESKVELINPPINTIANGEINGFVEIAIGIKPPIAVSDVNTIGKKRTSPASRIASSKLRPSSRNWFVKSTSKIEFLTSQAAMLRDVYDKYGVL